MYAVHETGQSRYHSPSNQNAGNPDAGSDSVQHEIAGNFKEEITDKENPKDQSELLASDGQLFVHRQRGKPNVDAVEEGNDVKKKNERNDPNLHFPNGFRFYRDRGGCEAASQARLRGRV
jgi:hypothetical protein